MAEFLLLAVSFLSRWAVRMRILRVGVVRMMFRVLPLGDLDRAALLFVGSW